MAKTRRALLSRVTPTVMVVGLLTSFVLPPKAFASSPATLTWATRSSLPTPRYLPAVTTCPDGAIYVFGGTNHPTDNGGALPTVERYDPVSDSWSSRAPMPEPRREALAVAANNGKIYVIGGDDLSHGVDGSATVQEYDPGLDTWAIRSSVPRSASGFGGTLAPDGK